MNHNRLWELLAKRQSGEATPEEQIELNEYINTHGIDKNMLDKIGHFWETPLQLLNAPSHQEIDTKWQKIQSKILDFQVNNEVENTGKVVSIWRISYYKLAIAASVIAVIFIATDFWKNNAKKEDVPKQSQNIVSTKNGSKSKLQLPDGTVVWLNAGSKILYNDAFNKSQREVQLTGEAFFDVAHNAEKPFIIHTKAMNIKVLGTVFNVRAYPTDKFTEASLIKGSIEVTFPGNATKKIILKPNEKITVINTIENSNEAIEKETLATEEKENITADDITVSQLSYQPLDSSVIETAWATENKLVFRSKSFYDLSKDMERWFNINIKFADSTIMKVKFTGTFSTETITEALGALQLSYHFKYKVEKNNNIIAIFNR